MRSASGKARIDALAIPPAWTDVRIAARASARVQATGYDDAGRKQYIYHGDEVERRARRKYRRLLPLARRLPGMRETTNAHLRQKGLGRDRVMATVVRLMSRGFFRVGSERYAVDNKTFGIATLKKSHLEIRGHDLIFEYTGKGSTHQHRVVADTPLVDLLNEILELPGTRLFRFRDEDGVVHDVTASDVNAYLGEVVGRRCTSKDLRTWGGTVRAATILADVGPAATKREAEKNVVMTCRLVSSELGNTPAVCRSAYIHPLVLERYLRGETIAAMMRSEPRPVEAEAPVEFYPEEAALMRMLARWEEA